MVGFPKSSHILNEIYWTKTVVIWYLGNVICQVHFLKLMKISHFVYIFKIIYTRHFLAVPEISYTHLLHFHGERQMIYILIFSAYFL